MKYFEIDSRVGISGTQTCWNYPCVYDESSQKFFIWLGDVTIEKFTKTTFLNLVNFGQNLGATTMVLIMNREHTQKGIKILSLLLLINDIYRSIPETFQGFGCPQTKQEKHAGAYGRRAPRGERREVCRLQDVPEVRDLVGKGCLL